MKAIIPPLLSLAVGLAQVTVTGPVKTPTGQDWDGELHILAQMMFCNGVTYPPTTQRVKVQGGQLSLQIQPTDVCGSGYSYKVYYVRYGKTEHVTYWMVPSTPTTTTVQAVQTNVVPTPTLMIPVAQIGSPGPVGTVIMSNGYSWTAGYALTDPTTSVGDLIYRGSALTRLPIGTSGQVLTSNGVLPLWTNPSGGSWGSITGTLSNQVDLWAELSGKAASSHTHAALDTTSGIFSTARLGSGTASSSNFLRGNQTWSAVGWVDVGGKPSTFPPDAHGHPLAELTQSGAATGQIPKWNGTAWAPAADDVGGSPSWGSITGTLSNQGDLWAELSGKAASSHVHSGSDITSGTIATARLGSGTASSSNFLRGNQTWSGVGWTDVSGKPSTFPPDSHTHGAADLTQSGATTGQILKWNGTTWTPANDDTGGSPSWGSITGTLSNQTDLQNALDGKAASSHVHAAGDVTSGVLATARLGSGSASASTFLRGDQTWNAVEWTDVGGKPSTFPPSSHVHPLTELTQSGATVGQIPKWNGSAWVPSSDDTGGSPSWGSITGTLSNQTDLQSALDGKAALSHVHAAADIASGVLATARLGGGVANGTNFLRGDQTWSAVGWTDVGGKPSTFPPDSHSHASSDLTQSGATTNQALLWSGTTWVPANIVNSVFGRAGAVTAQSGDYAASQITNTPGGNIASTTVQGAINELDAEKAAASHTHAALDIVSGVLATARLGSGTPTSSNFLRGDQTWNAVGWADVTSKPSTFPPSAHSHSLGELTQSGATTGQVPKWNGTAWVPANDDVGSSAVWGSITGTLSNQTDLQGALDGKASVTHTHDGADITTGTIAPARLGSGTPSSSNFLRGDGTWADVGAGAPNYSQSFTAQTSVTLTHNAGTTNVLVSCYNSSNVEIIPQSVTLTSANVVDVTFATAQTGKCVVNSSGGGGGGGGGTVTSVGLSMPEGFTVSGSPVTSSGTLAVTTTLSGVVRATGGAFTVVSGNATDCVRVDGTSGACGGGGTIYTGTGLTGDGSAGNPVRVDPNGGVASQAAYQATIDFSSIAGRTCAEQNITAIGVTAGSTLAPGFPATLPTGLVGMMYAGSDVVVVRLCNILTSSIDPAAATFTVRVIGGF